MATTMAHVKRMVANRVRTSLRVLLGVLAKSPESPSRGALSLSPAPTQPHRVVASGLPNALGHLSWGRSEDKKTWRFFHFASKISDQRPETLTRLLTSMPDTQLG